MAFNIGPRIGVEGEKELKEALRAIIAQFKTLDAEMKAMEEAFKRGEKSQKAYTDYQEKAGKAQETLTKLTEEYAKWVDIAAEKHGVSSSQAEKYRTEIAKAGVEQEKLKTKTEEAAEAQEEFTRETESAEQALSALETALAAAGLLKGLDKLKELLEDCSRSAMEFESSMAAVARTTGLDGAELESMGASLKQLSTELPIAATELANLVADAGQLGIHTDELETFATVMAKVGTATELTAQDAGTLIAQLANVTGVRDFERLASMFLQLGDSTATTATKTIEMSQAMAASASMAGLSVKAIGAISATVASLGIESQAGGTAISTLVQNIYKAVENGGEQLEKFAAVAGMTAGEFKAAWAHDADNAFTTFIAGLDDVERNGGSAISMLTELGITNIRQTRAVLGLSQAEEQLAENINIASSAWDENTALNRKAQQMYDTTEGKFTMFRNAVNNLKIAIGDDLNPALAELAETGADVFDWAADFVEDHPEIVAALAGLASGLASAATGAVGLLAVEKAVTGVKKLGTALQGLKAASALGAIGVSLTGVIGAVAAVAALGSAVAVIQSNYGKMGTAAKDAAKDIKESSEAFKVEREETEKTTQATLDSIDVLKDLVAVEDKTAAQKQTISKFVEKLNKELPELAFAYDEETDALYRLGDESNTAADALFALAEAQAKQKMQAQTSDRITDLLVQQADATRGLKEAQDFLKSGEGNFWEQESARIAAYNYKQALADIGTELDELYAKLGEAGAVTGDNSEAIVAMGGVLGDAKIAIDGLAEAYETTYARISKSLDGLAGPLDELARNQENSVAKARKSLESQEGYYKQFLDAVENLIGRNIDGLDEYVLELYNSGQAGMDAIIDMATKTDEETADMVEAWRDVTAVKDEIADFLTRLETDFSTSLNNITSETETKLSQLNLSGEMYQMGRDTLQGYINGLYSRMSAVSAAVTAGMNAALNAARSTLDTHSPSKKFQELGAYSMLGYILGIDDEEAAVLARMKAMAQDAVAAFNNEASGIDPFAAPGIGDLTQRMGGALTSGAVFGTTNNKTVTLGEVNFTINAAAGQDVQAIADAVMDAIQTTVNQKGAVFG